MAYPFFLRLPWRYTGLGFIIGSLIALGIWLYDRRVTRKANFEIHEMPDQTMINLVAEFY